MGGRPHPPPRGRQAAHICRRMGGRPHLPPGASAMMHCWLRSDSNRWDLKKVSSFAPREVVRREWGLGRGGVGLGGGWRIRVGAMGPLPGVHAGAWRPGSGARSELRMQHEGGRGAVGVGWGGWWAGLKAHLLHEVVGCQRAATKQLCVQQHHQQLAGGVWQGDAAVGAVGPVPSARARPARHARRSGRSRRRRETDRAEVRARYSAPGAMMASPCHRDTQDEGGPVRLSLWEELGRRGRSAGDGLVHGTRNF